MNANYANQIPHRNAEFRPSPVYVISEEADSTTSEHTNQVLRVAIGLAILIILTVIILVIARSI